MARNAKVLIATAVVVLLSLLLAVSDQLYVGLGVFVVGMLGVAVLHQGRDDADDAVAGKAKLDRALEERATPPLTDSSPVISPASPSTPPAGGLPTWSPAAPSTPAAEPLVPRPPAPEAPPVNGAAAETRSTRATWQAWDDLDRAPVREEYDPENPLAALDRLDEIDPIAEVERLEGRAAETASAFSFSSAPLIDEAAVQTDADIMAASQATELSVSSGEESELARLLAKVQQRLAAYE